MLSQNPKSTQKAHHVKAVNRWNPFGIWRELKRASVFLVGGGGLLQDSTSRRSLIYYLALIYFAHLLNKPVFLAGQGIGPLRSEFLKNLTARCLSKAECIMVRDEVSLELLRALKIEAPVALGEDLALAYPIQSTSLQVSKFTSHMPNVLGISLKGDLSRRFAKALAAFLGEVCRRLKLKAVFIPAFPQQDLRLAETLAEAMREDSIVIDTHALGITEIVNLIAACDLLLASRLHALEFALLTHVPFAAISSDPKIEAFVRKLEFCSGLRVPLIQLTSLQVHKLTGLMEDIEELWAQRELYQQAFERSAQMLRASAERSLKEFCQKMAPFLGEEG